MIFVTLVNESIIINETKITLLDANHCPGSAVILFEFKNGESIFHSGDFRFDPSRFVQNPPLRKYLEGGFDKVYLDTTFCHPDYTFASQSKAIATLVETVRLQLKKQPNTLVMIGSYTIGKERILESLASQLKCKVYANPEKYEILSRLELAYFDIFTQNEAESNIHVVGMNEITWSSLEERKNMFSRKYKEVLGIKPTGWTRNKIENYLNLQNKREFSMIECPYSEHSSFDELREFVRIFKPKEIIPTVNVDNVDNMIHYLTVYNHNHKTTDLKPPKSLLQPNKTLFDFGGSKKTKNDYGMIDLSMEDGREDVKKRKRHETPQEQKKSTLKIVIDLIDT